MKTGPKHTPYGLRLYEPGERWYRGRLWARAIERGVSPDVLADAYNVTREAVRKSVERYRAYGKS